MSLMWPFRPFALLVVLPLAAACARGTVLRMTPNLGDSRVLATSADVRIVTSTPVISDPENTNAEFVKPRQINCVEPSPDVARAVSEAFASSGGLFARARRPGIPAGADLQTTLALSRSYTEAVAQMTERLATIQLLRDGLFRACEAYQNGAITATTYATLVGRYDKTMITMLLGELAAGNFGRSLAALSGTASSKASASVKVDELRKRVDDSSQKVNEKRTDNQEAVDQLNQAVQNGDNPATQEQMRKRVLNTSTELANELTKHREALDQLNTALEATAESQAGTTAIAAGGIAKNPAEAVARVSGDLVQLQANYLNDNNIDAIKIACLSSLGREPDGRGERARGGKVAHAMRYNYDRAMSVWCDELIQTLVRNEADILEYNIRPGTTKPIGDRPIKMIFDPPPSATGPYGAVSEVPPPVVTVPSTGPGSTPQQKRNPAQQTPTR